MTLLLPSLLKSIQIRYYILVWLKLHMTSIWEEIKLFNYYQDIHFSLYMI